MHNSVFSGRCLCNTEMHYGRIHTHWFVHKRFDLPPFNIFVSDFSFLLLIFAVAACCHQPHSTHKRAVWKLLWLEHVLNQSADYSSNNGDEQKKHQKMSSGNKRFHVTARFIHHRERHSRSKSEQKRRAQQENHNMLLFIQERIYYCYYFIHVCVDTGSNFISVFSSCMAKLAESKISRTKQKTMYVHDGKSITRWANIMCIWIVDT